MALLLDASQSRIIATKRRNADKRPKYYSATVKKELPISEDFEAFLILQGRQRNKDTVKWLEQTNDFAIRDSDRDALAAVALDKEQSDASASEREILPLIRLFNRFREGYNMSGFEQVTEAGALLADIQRPMSEIQNIMARLKNRQLFSKISLGKLGERGLTSESQKQLNSWFGSLTAY